MEALDKLIVMVSLSALVVCLIWEHGSVVVGDDKASIPTDRLNKSISSSPVESGPAYLLSNLPAWRQNDDNAPSLGGFSC